MHIQGKPIHPPWMIHGIIWVIYIINRTFFGMYIQVLDTCKKINPCQQAEKLSTKMQMGLVIRFLQSMFGLWVGDERIDKTLHPFPGSEYIRK